MHFSFQFQSVSPWCSKFVPRPLYSKMRKGTSTWNVTFCTAISRLGNTFAFSHRGHTMARTEWVSPRSFQRACYVAQLIDEAVWWHNVMKAVSHARIMSDEKLESHREDQPTLQAHANAEKRAPGRISPAAFALAVSFLRSHYWILSEDIIW